MSLMRGGHVVWKPNLHPKYPKGTPGGKGGQFMPVGSPHWSAHVAAQKKAHAAAQAAPNAPAAKKAAPKPAPVKAAKAAAKKAAPSVPAKKAAPAPPKPPKTPAATKVAKKAAPSTPTIKKAAPKATKTPTPHPLTIPGLKAVSTDAELDARAQRAENAGGRDSAFLHMTNGRWTASRAALHQKIVDEIWAAQGGDAIPTQHRAVMLGGPVGAGKSTTVAQRYTTSDYLMLAPDDVKEALARHGAIPDATGTRNSDLSPMERSAMVHQESLHIANMLAQKAYARGTNVIWDGTMGNHGNVSAKIRDLRRDGYGVEGLFVDAPLSVTKKRATERYRAGQRDWERGVGQGGRHVPDWVIQATQGAKSNFDALRRGGAFDRWASYDNSGAAPVLKRQG